jgi:hypothetical protein
MKFGDDTQLSARTSYVEPYQGPPVTCEPCVEAWVAAGHRLPPPERATHTVVLDAEEGRFVAVCERHLEAYRQNERLLNDSRVVDLASRRRGA